MFIFLNPLPQHINKLGSLKYDQSPNVSPNHRRLLRCRQISKYLRDEKSGRSTPDLRRGEVLREEEGSIHIKICQVRSSSDGEHCFVMCCDSRSKSWTKLKDQNVETMHRRGMRVQEQMRKATLTWTMSASFRFQLIRMVTPRHVGTFKRVKMVAWSFEPHIGSGHVSVTFCHCVNQISELLLHSKFAIDRQL